MMKTKVLVVVCATVFILLLAGRFSSVGKLFAQAPAGRIAGEIDNTARLTIRGTRPPLARAANDAGRISSETTLHGMNLVFKRSAAQDADLQALIAAQQNPSSRLYHQWLTPDEFGARFGMTDSDIAKAQAWLQSQGFMIDGISRSRNSISFSGTADQVQSAFGAELHYYNVNGTMRFAPSSEISVPAALAPVVQTVTNLSSFRLQPRFRKPKANFTSGQSGHTFLTPADVATIYDVKPAYLAGFDGTGQTIAVVGQSSVSVTDMENFEQAAGLAVKDPTLVLVPGSGSVAEFQGDESESDLDLEYSGGMAPGATIMFIYTGDNANFSVWDSITYAVQNDVAPIISDSYGICETALAPGEYTSLNGILQQGAAQGQSIIVPAGDSGSPDCAGTQGFTTAQQEALAVDFPASSQYVTAMGGSEFPAADVCNLSTCSTPPPAFWQPASGSDVTTSAVGYIPEQAWNDDIPPSNGNPAVLSSGGGGISTLTPKPSWQAGVPGISGTMRLVPDLVLSGSPNNAGYLYCTSDTSAWDTANGQVASCNSGFRDSSSSLLTVAGGSSFDAPLFAGLVAIINQKENSVGQGVLGAIIYPLASNATTYSHAFHDITTGTNNCSAGGSTVCAGQSMTQYVAGTGYDMVSGLGSIDFNNLLAAWPAGSAKTASKVTLSAASETPAVGANDAITITVAPASGSGTPSGTVNVDVSCSASVQSLCSASSSSLPLSSGSATYSFSPAVVGADVIVVSYSGDPTFAPSAATLALNNQSFRLAATNPTIVSGSTGTATVTITPQQGYTGSISWVVSSSPTLTNGCFSLPAATVTNSTAVQATLTVNTSSRVCGGSAMLKTDGRTMLASSHSAPPRSPRGRMPFGFAAGGLLVAGLVAWRPNKNRGVAGIVLLVALTIALPGCGGGSPSNNNNNNNNSSGGKVTPGTYTLTVVGTDTSSSAISSSTAVTVTVN